MMPDPFSENEMLEHSARAIGKIAARPRGVFEVTHTEIEAMAVLLMVLGVPPLKYGYQIKDHAAFFKEFGERMGGEPNA